MISLTDYILERVYGKNEMDTQISELINNFDLFEVVNELPEQNIKEKIYLIPNNDNENEKNLFDVYIYVDDGWEQIDSFSIDDADLTGLTELINSKVDKENGKGLSTNDFTNNYKNILDNLSPRKVFLDTVTGVAIIDYDIDIDGNVYLLNGRLVYDSENDIITNEKSDRIATTYDLNNKADKNSIPSKTSQLTNDSNYISTSSTNGLIKNDGSIDTNNYALNNVATSISNGLMSANDKNKLDNLNGTGSWEDIQNNPFSTSTPSSFANANHTHGNISNDGKIGTTTGKIITTGTNGVLQASDNIASGLVTYNNNTVKSHLERIYDAFHNVDDAFKDKADEYHSSTLTTYGVGTTSSYGHNKIRDNLTASTLVNGESLSAHQGYVLKGLIDNKVDTDNVYTKSEIVDLISNSISNLQLFEVVEELPSNNIKSNRLYLIVNGESITNNSYDVYLYVDNSWERLDSLEFDISNYYNKTETDNLLNNKVDTTDNRLTNARTPLSHTHGNLANTGAIDNDITAINKFVVTDENNKINTIGTIPYNKIINTPTIPSKISDLTNDSGFLTQHQSLTDYLQKSNTNGLVKNDGTIDTNNYLTQHQDITGKVNISDIKDNLTSTDTDKPLSANQGKELKTLIDSKVDTSDSRLTDSRTPTSHTHTKSEITDFPTSSSEKVFYGTCTTSSNDSYKAVSVTDWTWTTGNILIVNFSNKGSNGFLDVYLKIGGTSKQVYYKSTERTYYYWEAGATVSFVYNGSAFIMINASHATTSSWGATILTDSVSSTSKTSSATPNSVKQAYDLANSKLSGTKVTSWSSTVSDDNIPSEKLVKDSLDGKASSSHTQASSTITDMGTVDLLVTYTDNTFETLTLFKKNTTT